METREAVLAPPSFELVPAGSSASDRAIPVFPPATLGRSESADIIVASAEVSRRHARLEWIGDALVLVDLHSRNGTYVNGARVTSPLAVWVGDEIRLGETRFLLRQRMLPTLAQGTTGGRSLLQEPTWQLPWQCRPREPAVGRVVALLAAGGALLLLPLVFWFISLGLARQEGSYIFLAEIAAGLVFAHVYVAGRLRRASPAAFRVAILLGVLWTLSLALTIVAVPATVFLLRPARRRYYLSREATEPAECLAPPLLRGRVPGQSAPAHDAPAPSPPTDGTEDALLFSALSPTWRERLQQAAVTQTYKAGAIVVREDEAGEDLYWLLDGQLEVYASGLAGELLPLTQLEPGECFGEISLLTGEPRTATVRALTEARVARVPAGLVREALAEEPAFGESLRERVDFLDVTSFLQRFSPFARLPQPAVAAAVRRVRRERATAGQQLLDAGQAGQAWYLIRRGTALATWPGGRRLSFGPGDSFGEAALLTDHPSSYTVVAATDLELLVLPRPDFEAVVATYPPLRRFFGALARTRYAAAPDEALGVPDPVAIIMPGLSRRDRRWVWLLLFGGVALLAMLSVVSAQTGSGVVIGATILLGSLLAPAVYYHYLWERDLLRTLSWWQLAGIATATALVAVPLVFALESVLPAGAYALGPALVTALIEEAVKPLADVWLLWRRQHRFELDGIVYGVAAGMSFAVVENVAYAVRALAEHAGSPEAAVASLLQVVWLRMVTTFVGHGVWTGLVCAALWQGVGTGRPRLSPAVFWGFAVAVLLHTLWDWSPLVFMIPVGIIGLILLRQRIQRASEEELQSIEALALAWHPVPGEPAGRRSRARCPSCGVVAVAGSLYCGRCGAALPQDGGRARGAAGASG